MAAGFQVKVEFDKQTTLYILTDIFHAIDNGVFETIDKLFTDLSYDQRVSILNSTIQCWSPLSYAIQKDQLEISEYLLEHSLRQGRRTMCTNWHKYYHPLTAALENGEYDLISLVARNLHDINEILPGCCTPLTKAINSGDLEAVQLMVRLGADVNFPCLHGITPLMESTSKPDICRYLIENDADIDQPDARGYGALHSAVDGGYMDSIELLVNAGADVQLVGKDNMTPLLLAAVNLNMKVFLYLKNIPAYSDPDKMDAKEVYNAFILFTGHSTLDYWYQTTKERESTCPKSEWLPETDMLLPGLEFSSIEELNALKNQPAKLAFQAVLVICRVFRRSNTIYIRAIMGAALVMKDAGKLRLLRYFLDYTQSFAKKAANRSCVLENSVTVKLLFDYILAGNANGEEEEFFQSCALTMFETVADAIVEEWSTIKWDLCNEHHIENRLFKQTVDVFLHMLNKIYYLPIPPGQRKHFDAVAEKVVASDPRVEYQQSLLHRVIRLSQARQWRAATLVEMLLKTNADPDSKDYFRHTPLMYALKYASDAKLEEIVLVLINGKCSVDCLSKEGYSALEFSRWQTLSNIPKMPRRLDCMAMRVIVINRIPYLGVLKEKIVQFIEYHR